MKKNWLVKCINKNYFLTFSNKTFRCQIGEGGLRLPAKKVEGDKITPVGKWYFQKLYYRADRILKPKLKKKNILKISQLTVNSGWCDDLRSNFYNKHINIDNIRFSNVSYENLWREDEAYDIIIVISHNIKPIIKNKGSAIFIHCSFSDYRKTQGCLALKKKDLIFLIKNIQKNSYVKI